MPTYQYACTACGHRFEAVQAFTDDSLTSCPECGGQLRKVYGSVGVVFKGSGFYRTDSRNGKTSTAAPASGEKSSEKSSEKSDQPAAKSDSSRAARGGRAVQQAGRHHRHLRFQHLQFQHLRSSASSSTKAAS